jgi:vancomycin permeability regulator SanA
MSLLLTNLYVLKSSEPHIYGPEEVPSRSLIIVLGAAVGRTRPSYTVARRLDTALALFEAGRADRILVSGRTQLPYDEVGVMRRYLEDRGVPAEAILDDGLGVRTYETFRRAREVFGVEDALVVSSHYHVPRSVFLARHFGIDAVGVEAQNDGPYHWRPRWRWRVREAFARTRAVLDTWLLG